MLVGEDRIDCLTRRADERDAFICIGREPFLSFLLRRLFCDGRREGDQKQSQAVGADLYYSIASWRFSYWTSPSGKKKSQARR
jgi:hypothetical protein